MTFIGVTLDDFSVSKNSVDGLDILLKAYRL